MNTRPHAWHRVVLYQTPHGPLYVTRCALCRYRRDVFEARGLNPDDDVCPLTDQSLCRAIGTVGGVCRLPKGHAGDHREVFNSTWMNVADTHGGAEPFPNWPHGVPVAKEGR